MIDIFISHSAKDVTVVEALIELLRKALTLRAENIRCTSVDGYRLPVGASTMEQIRQEVHTARIFICLITRDSLQSPYVLFELGARWGAGNHLVPLLAAGTPPSALVAPLSGLNALSCDSEAQIHQLLNDVAGVLGTSPGNPSSYLSQIENLRHASEERVRADAPLVIIFESFMTGEIFIQEIGKKFAHILIPVTIINESNRTITPEYLQLTVDIEGRNLHFFPFRIPPKTPFHSEKQIINIPDAEKYDLLGRIGSLLPGVAKTGLLMFASEETTYDVVQGYLQRTGEPRMSANCTDIRGYVHAVLLVKQPHNVPGAVAKLGISSKMKPPPSP